jgi:molybdopterin molybdotransferase
MQAMSSIPEDISLGEAMGILKAVSPPLKHHESVPSSDALGRILAEDITSPINVPPQDTAAVDGYAFFHGDLTFGLLPIQETIKAGHPLNGAAMRGYAYRIFTGAPMPLGADTVAMQEQCSIDDEGRVILPQSLEFGKNFRPLGENIAQGEVILTAGTRLGAAELGLAAAIGLLELMVSRRLTIAILSTGDEIAVSENDTGREGIIHDSNRPMLQHLMVADGHDVLDFGIIPDNPAALTEAYGQAAIKADVILSSGGSSDGDEDYAREAIIRNGGIVDFWRLAVKPGRPMAAGRIGNTPIYCTPGNPVAAFVCTRLLVCPMLAYLQGRDMPPPLKVDLPSGFTHRHSKGRTEFLRARLDCRGGLGKIILNGRKGAGVLSSLTGADGLVEIPADHADVKEGDLLPFILLRESGL